MFTDQALLPPGARVATGAAPERTPTENQGPDVGAPSFSRIRDTFDRVADRSLDTGGLDFDFGEHRVGVGGNGDDMFSGTAEIDTLFGRGGDDRLIGLGEGDVLQGDDGNDSLEGGDGSDFLDGGRGDDRLDGGAQADVLLGEAGRDRLDGGAGHDMLEGGKGDDELIGGAGADAFIVEPGSGDDVIFDFQALGAAQGAFDHIALRNIRPDEVTITDTDRGVRISWDTKEGDGSVLLLGLTSSDLRQSDFMFLDEPGFVAGVSSAGSDFIF